MTDNRVSQLLPASFRGVPFRVRGEVLPEEGRKIVLHEYVNSSERFVEDLGQLPSKFTVTAFVHGQDFQARAAALRQALNERGPGELTLPVFGTEEVYALQYRIDASQTSVGEISFQLEFAAGRPAAGPSVAQRDIEEVWDLGDQARASIEDAFGSLWGDITSAANAAVAQSDTIQAFTDVVSDFSQILGSGSLTSINGILRSVQLNSPALIRDATDLASKLIGSDIVNPGLWQTISFGISDLVRSGLAISEAFDASMRLTSFGGGLSLSLSTIRGASTPQVGSNGSTIPLWPDNTIQRIRRNANRENMVYANRVAALVTAYELAAAQEYSTLDELNETRSRLEDANETIMRVETSDGELIQSQSSVRFAVAALRLAALDVMEQKRQTAYDTVSVSGVPSVSAFVEAYDLYAEEFTEPDLLEQRAIDLRALNPEKRATDLGGTITAFRG